MTSYDISTAADPVALTAAALVSLPEGVDAPGYDRAALRSGVVHFGVGGFHRAHQAVYFDELARRGLADGWGLTGVGLHRPEMGEVMRAQDCLYLVVARGAHGTTARVVGVMGTYLFAPDQREAVLQTLSDPATKLVTLTITGSGYLLNPDGDFSDDDPLVAAELEDPGRPDTVFGYLVEALDRRRAAGVAPFTVLSCDNIPSNGTAARTMVVSFAQLRDSELARWIEDNVAFPASMVDRITPETTPEERDRIVRSLGVDDRWPVITEPFSQWVIEDVFCNDRPPLDEVGVQYVADVAPYELTKKRLLNASHCALGYLGYLAGHRTTAEVMADPAYAAYIAALIDEVTPLLPRVDGIDLSAYKKSLLERLANPEMADQLSRLCRRGSTKVPSYLLPSIIETRAAGRPAPMLTLAVAGWFRYLQGHDYAGEPIDVEGPRRDEFVALARQEDADPRPLLTVRDVFGDLADDASFVRDLHVASEALRAGPRDTIETWLAVSGGAR
ncbi:mannitol 2-dehydrogenase [Paractinoplanes abujensis]|uniref:Mannitol-1-phosphate 5-dehydrogenase n=1 Tax=Paractinoplanes abujensis TaxID=882441 RepID=A0A7W7CMR3_9ACTN|nr:mannitol dehydrogenase family protein [Actinoplanes abujensis]MBB4689928.1 fructuronate reductase/mannitol 2-dehydrogenase [Actinoplanes abujensis]GID24666.1 mannitol 2-dehydrogenase [Actinoplanes abujensis]